MVHVYVHTSDNDDDDEDEDEKAEEKAKDQAGEVGDNGISGVDAITTTYLPRIPMERAGSMAAKGRRRRMLRRGRRCNVCPAAWTTEQPAS